VKGKYYDPETFLINWDLFKMKFIRQYNLFFIALLAFVVETGMLSFWRNKFGAYASPGIFFLASITVGLVGLKLSFQKAGIKSLPLFQRAVVSMPGKIGRLGVIILVMVCCFFTAAPCISYHFCPGKSENLPGGFLSLYPDPLHLSLPDIVVRKHTHSVGVSNSW